MSRRFLHGIASELKRRLEWVVDKGARFRKLKIKKLILKQGDMRFEMTLSPEGYIDFIDARTHHRRRINELVAVVENVKRVMYLSPAEAVVGGIPPHGDGYQVWNNHVAIGFAPPTV